MLKTTFNMAFSITNRFYKSIRKSAVQPETGTALGCQVLMCSLLLTFQETDFYKFIFPLV